VDLPHVYSYSCRTRLSTIDFPHFLGEVVHQWIYQCKSYFLIDNTFDDGRVKLAIVHLEGRALQWHTNSATYSPLISWEAYTKLLIE